MSTFIKQQAVVLGVLFVCIVAGITLHFHPNWVNALQAFLRDSGHSTYFIVMTIYNIVLIPFPYDVFVVATPYIYPDEFWQTFITVNLVTITAGIITYVLGYYGQPYVEKWWGGHTYYARTMAYVYKHGALAAFLSTLTPLPFSLVGWVCGLSRTHFWLYLASITIARSMRNTLVLYAAWRLVNG